MSPAPLPSPIRLSPLQQWHYFSRPVSGCAWLRQRYGDLAVLRFQGRDHVVTFSPEGIRQVFSAAPEGYDVFWKEAFTGLSGSKVVFVLSGEEHRHQRQFFASTFNAHNYLAQAEAIRTVTRHHIMQWQPGQVIRAIDTTVALWLDVIMRLFFGLQEEKFLEEAKRIHFELEQRMHPLIVFFPALQRPWFPLWRRYARNKVALSEWVSRYLAERRAQEGRRDDVVGHIMALCDESGCPITDEHIQGMIYGALGLGHQTTATALAWALYELGRHPPVLRELRRELTVLGTDPDPSSLVTLPYLSATCNETLRLHPIIAECARVPNAPMEILGYTIPAGKVLVVPIVGIHHDPTLFPQPELFQPERFIERKYSLYEFLPFGGGHRRCMGAGLAEYIMRIALAVIVSHWEFETAAADQDVRKSLSMGPRHGVLLRVKARHQLSHTNNRSADQGASAHA